MASYLDMVNRIADETLRPDMTQQIKSCIREAIQLSETERYWFNQFRDRVFNTVAGQEFYGAADLADIAQILAIDSIAIDAGGMRVRLVGAGYEAIEDWSIDPAARGQPTHYAYWGQQLRLYPIPAAAYSVRLSGLFKLPALINDADQNAWTNDAEALIRNRAKAIFLAQYLMDDAGAGRARGLEMEAREMLAHSTSRRQATGTIRPAL